MSTDTPARCVLVTADRELATTVGDLIARMPGAELTGSLDPVRALSGPPACDVLLVADGGEHPPAELAAQLGAACPGAGLVLLAGRLDLDTYRAALAAGAHAVVGLPPSPAQLIEAVGEAARRAAATRPAAGVLVTVAGAAGGCGASAVALTLALEGRGLLADLSHRWGPAVPAAPGTSGSVADLARVGPAVAGALGSVVGRHPAGIDLLQGPDDPQLLELLPAGLGSVLARELRTRSGLSIVDVGTVTHPAARELAAAGDRLLIVLGPDPRGASAARALITAAVTWGSQAPAAGLVVNRWNRLAELSAGSLERMVGCPVLAVVRDRPRAMVGYRNGRPDLDRWPSGTPFRALAALAASLRAVQA
jgi:pilus assembly protein CpaE